MNYRPFALILLISLAMPVHGARGRKLMRKQYKSQAMERRDFLTVERARSRSRSRQRELSLERDRERAAAMSRCINFGTVLVTVASKIATVILKLVVR